MTRFWPRVDWPASAVVGVAPCDGTARHRTSVGSFSVARGRHRFFDENNAHPVKLFASPVT
jgi:hypothetical protein